MEYHANLKDLKYSDNFDYTIKCSIENKQKNHRKKVTQKQINYFGKIINTVDYKCYCKSGSNLQTIATTKSIVYKVYWMVVMKRRECSPRTINALLPLAFVNENKFNRSFCWFSMIWTAKLTIQCVLVQSSSMFLLEINCFIILVIEKKPQ